MATENSSPGDLELRPEAVPRLQAAFQRALDQLTPLLADGQGYRMAAPAMRDDASVQFQAAFNRFATDGPDSATRSLAEYATRLRGVLDRLGEIQRAYATHEQRTAADLSHSLEA